MSIATVSRQQFIRIARGPEIRSLDCKGRLFIRPFRTRFPENIVILILDRPGIVRLYNRDDIIPGDTGENLVFQKFSIEIRKDRITLPSLAMEWLGNPKAGEEVVLAPLETNGQILLCLRKRWREIIATQLSPVLQSKLR